MFARLAKVTLTLLAGAVVYATYGVYKDREVTESIQDACKSHAAGLNDPDPIEPAAAAVVMKRFVAEHLRGWEARYVVASEMVAMHTWLRQQGWLE